jgi:hypothetical protein
MDSQSIEAQFTASKKLRIDLHNSSLISGLKASQETCIDEESQHVMQDDSTKSNYGNDSSFAVNQYNDSETFSHSRQ